MAEPLGPGDRASIDHTFTAAVEGIFPRVHVNGPAASGVIHYFTAVEYDYERIPVPEVTQGSGPDVVEQSATFFAKNGRAGHTEPDLYD